MERRPVTARFVPSLEGHKTPSVGKTAGAYTNKTVHAPLRGAFLAVSPKGVAHVKDGGGGYSNIRTRTRRIANKVLVLTLPALRNFGIIARHKRLGAGFSFVLPVKARAGRTTQALAL